MININKNLFLKHNQNIMAIMSGEGSVGRTWLSITLAHAFNLLQQKVLLVDADNGLMNTKYQLGLQDITTLNRIIEEDKALNQAIHPINKKKFDIICGISGSNILADIPTGRLQIMREDLGFIADRYNKVIIDLPGDEKIVEHFLPYNADILLICTNEPSNLVSTYKFLQDSIQHYKYKQLQIVVNYANSYEEGLQTYNILRHTCEKYIRSTPKLLGILRRDTRVRDIIRDQVSLLSKYPNSDVAEDIMNMARKILYKGENNE